MQKPLSEGALYIYIYIYIYITRFDLDESTYTNKKKTRFCIHKNVTHQCTISMMAMPSSDQMTLRGSIRGISPIYFL